MEPTSISPCDKVVQVFEYLEALNQHRNPVIRELNAQPWLLWLDALPLHPSVERNEPVPAPGDEGGNSGPLDRPYLLVRRAELTPPPAPPGELSTWLLPGWNNPDQDVSVLEKRNETLDDKTTLVKFEDSPTRHSKFEAWKAQRNAWAEAERPARRARELFERLYALNGELERESGKFELLVGDGHLLWNHSSGAIRHPLLLQRVDLTFDSNIPAFAVAESPTAPELYTALLSNLEELDGAGFAKLRVDLDSSNIRPLGQAGTREFLQRLVLLLGPNGALTDAAQDAKLPDTPILTRRPVLFLRNKSHGMAAALRGIIDDLRNGGEISPALLRTVGEETPIAKADARSTDPLSLNSESEQILLAKPANKEQLQIAERLERHGCVLVQGPPGTGKTHTIGNLIGHLLSEGKSVLVTSHGTKALRVLRRQIPEPLQPLCVSVLDDAESQRQLQDSITAIAERLSTADVTQLQREADALALERQQQLHQLSVARKRLLDARTDEYRDVVIGGERVAPAKAAREVARESGNHGWTPAPVTLGATVPVSETEARTLYASNRTVFPEDERELVTPLPELDQLFVPTEFKELLEEMERFAAIAAEDDPALWAPDARPDPAALDALQKEILRVMEPLEDLAPWKLEAITAGAGGEARLAPWQTLIEFIQDVHHTAELATLPQLTHAPRCTDETSATAEVLEIATQLRTHLEKGGNLGTWSLLFRPSWKRFLKKWQVATGAITKLEHVQAVELHLQLTLKRETLAGRWNRQLTQLGMPSAEQLGPMPERPWLQFVPKFEQCLRWQREAWAPLQRALVDLGFRWSLLLEAQPPVMEQHGEFLRLYAAATNPLLRHIRARAAVLRRAALEVRLRAAALVLAPFGGTSSCADSVRALALALEDWDPNRYAAAHARLADLLGKRAQLEERTRLLARIEAVAPAWAAAIRERLGVHGEAQPPGPVDAAWRWRQLHDELERRGKVRLEELQDQIEDLSAQLRKSTTQLIDRRAWTAQVARSNLKQRQSLMGWLSLMKRIGKGTGKRAPALRAEASRAMSACRDAVPVWVMPLNHVAVNFTAATRFDVVIIDEASQSDAMALAALYLGRQVVVVGDHEQVSPSAVGQELATVDRLIEQHLRNIPNRKLYDGRLSVYELAQQSFGGVIVLREHFRCVPDIIQFSSDLSYEGKILPLRDATNSDLRPAVCSYRVEHGGAEQKVNLEEAQATAALIVAASQHPAYREKTFGVISLVGDEQALEIERLLRQRLSPSEYERRHLLCGNAAQFQGDERDVMFLAMVDSSQDGPLSLRGIGNLTFKQRFNVAASRAKDQMWVVHSLNPGIDLKSGDLRRMLLEHCEDPRASEKKAERQLAETESVFEREVMLRLTRAGFKVTPQWPVGKFRIDLVVEGKEKRLAVECDGDRFHGLAKLPEDMERQAILERLGWRFVRIRGSAFFRAPEAAMSPVFKRLEELGIKPWSHNEASSQTVPAAELQKEVVREAEALLRAWRKPEEVETGPVLEQPLVSQRGSREAERPLSVVEAETPVMEKTVAIRSSRALLTEPDPSAAPQERKSMAVTPPLRPATRLSPSADPLVDAVKAALPPSAALCPKCGAKMPVWVGRYGPFMKCADPECQGRTNVPIEILSAALKTLPDVCSCGAPLKIAHGQSPFIGCSRYPDCSNNIPWRDFRDRLRRKTD